MKNTSLKKEMAEISNALNPACLHPIFEFIFTNADHCGIRSLFLWRRVSREWKSAINCFLHDHTFQLLENCIGGSGIPREITMKYISKINLPDLPTPYAIAQSLHHHVSFADTSDIIRAVYGHDSKIRYRVLKEFLLQPEYAVDISISDEKLDNSIENLFNAYFFNEGHCYCFDYRIIPHVRNIFEDCIEKCIPQFARAYRVYCHHHYDDPHDIALLWCFALWAMALLAQIHRKLLPLFAVEI
ncbi:MAG: hypothetical protein M0R33_13815 [Methylomonas sp.]|uniref:hypothetical protein n=1 Tax=Methylomonas sp. TaxID=418 RepID=UPI0025DA5F31|nr:hypothetical protein [Methylomonas sp.]MCK9607512.1 hypothetical protein [Methylomonas sp.]